MSEQLASAIEDIAKGIAAGRFRSEAEISRGIIQKILFELGWPVFDMRVVTPEFRIGDGARKVDYALCHAPGKAAILIEVKDLGKADRKGQKQLFEYCFHQGVPIAVLTDGRTWSFFYPAGQGDYDERRFARVDLLDDDPHAAASTLTRYLNINDVESQEARKRAQKDYDEARSQRNAALKFEPVWNRLLSEPEPLLLDLFLEEIEKEANIKPDPERAAAFIRKHAVGGEVIRKPPKVKPGKVGKPPSKQPETHPQAPKEPPLPPGPNSRKASFTFQGRTQTFNSGNELLAAVFSMFAEKDPDFCRRYSEGYAGRSKKYVAKTQEELNPSRPDLRAALPLPGGWWISTYCSNMQKLKWIRAACQLVGLEYGRDIEINLPNTQKKDSR